MPTERMCPDCQKPMVAGVMIDYRRASAHPAEWVEADLQTSAWTGSVKNEPRYEVAAYRCASCGLLKLYADAPASSGGSAFG